MRAKGELVSENIIKVVLVTVMIIFVFGGIAYPVTKNYILPLIHSLPTFNESSQVQTNDVLVRYILEGGEGMSTGEVQYFDRELLRWISLDDDGITLEGKNIDSISLSPVFERYYFLRTLPDYITLMGGKEATIQYFQLSRKYGNKEYSGVVSAEFKGEEYLLTSYNELLIGTQNKGENLDVAIITVDESKISANIVLITLFMEAPAFAALDEIGKSHIRAFQGAKILLKGDLLSASLIQFPVTLSQNSEACKEGYSFRYLREEKTRTIYQLYCGERAIGSPGIYLGLSLNLQGEPDKGIIFVRTNKAEYYTKVKRMSLDESKLAKNIIIWRDSVLSEPISIPYRKPNSEVGIMKDSSFNTCARKEGGSLVIALNKGAPSNGACRGND